MTHRAKVNSESLYNILSTVALSGIAFFTMPIFTRLLGAEQYGKFAVFNSWISVVFCFMGLKTQASLSTGRYHFKDEYELFRSSTLLLGTLISGAEFLLILVFHKSIGRFLGYSDILLITLLICGFTHYIVDFSQMMFIYEKKAKWNFVLSILLSLSTVSLSLYFIKASTLESTYLSRVYGTAIPYVIAAIGLWGYIYFRKPSGINRVFAKYSLTLGTPLVFHTLAQTVLSQSDRVMMQQLSYDDSAVGIYSFFCTFTGILTIILNALNTSWCPFYFDDLSENNIPQINRKTKNYQELFTIICCGFILLSKEVVELFASEDFYPGMSLIPIQTIGIFFIFMYQFPVNFEFYHKKTTIISLGTTFCALGNIALNLLLIPDLGMYGAAIATTVSYLLLFIAHFYIVKRLNAQSKFLMSFSAFIPWIGILAVTCMLFFILSDFAYIRWTIGFGLGAYLAYSIFRRKSIF